MLARLARSAGWALAGGAGCVLVVRWSQLHWWVGASVVAAVVLLVLVLWRW